MTCVLVFMCVCVVCVCVCVLVVRVCARARVCARVCLCLYRGCVCVCVCECVCCDDGGVYVVVWTRRGLLHVLQPKLPFSVYGTVAMARSEDDPNDASSQFFFLLFDPELTTAGAFNRC